jgi:hypothetical protein
VVVLQHHHRPPRIGAALYGGLGERLVDHAVALPPGAHERIVDVRLVGQPEQLVLREPEERVGHRRVVSLPGVGRQVAQIEPDVLAGQLLFYALGQPVPARTVAIAQQSRRLAVAALHRATDPRYGCQPAHLGERRDQAARPAPHPPVAVTQAPERQRPAIRDDHQPPVRSEQGGQVFTQPGQPLRNALGHVVCHWRRGRRRFRGHQLVTLRAAPARRPRQVS